MSAPARRLARPSASPRHTPSPRRTGADRGAGPGRRSPATDGATRAPRSRPHPRATRRRKHHLGFAILASAFVGGIVLGIVVLNVLLAQLSFRIESAERGIEALERERLHLVREQATLSAPDRIAGWAERHGMRLPDDIRILRAPDGPPAPAGADTTSGGGRE